MVTHPGAWFQVKCRCFELGVRQSVSLRRMEHHLTWSISRWDLGNQLKQRAQGLSLALLLTSCYRTGQPALSASVSLSVKQRSKGLICLKAGGVNQRFLVRGDLRWCLWFLFQTPRDFRVRHCRVSHNRPSCLCISFISCRQS